MRLETFSYLPPLSATEVAAQVRSIVDRGLVVSIEYSDQPQASRHYWTLWKLPLLDVTDPQQVLAELDACRQANLGAYVRISGYDPVRQGQVVSFVAHRPEES